MAVLSMVLDGRRAASLGFLVDHKNNEDRLELVGLQCEEFRIFRFPIDLVFMIENFNFATSLSLSSIDQVDSTCTDCDLQLPHLQLRSLWSTLI